MRVQPEESIYWKVQNKVPGLTFAVEQMRMDFNYSTKYKKGVLPEAYERLLLECLAADHSHFVSAEELSEQRALSRTQALTGPYPEPILNTTRTRSRWRDGARPRSAAKPRVT